MINKIIKYFGLLGVLNINLYLKLLEEDLI